LTRNGENSRLNFATKEKGRRMGLMDYLKTQFLEIIQWEDDSRDTLSWRYPDQDKEIKNGAQLIVRESQVAQFVHLGQFADTFVPGKHTLSTQNIPILSTIMGWKFGFESPFKCDIYYVTTRLFTGNKWGTSNPVMLRDPDFGIVRARAFGTYDFKVVDPKVFLKEVAGTDHHFRLEEFQDSMRSRLVSVFTDALASSKIPVLDLASRYTEVGEALLPVLNPVLREKYGLELGSFLIENVSVPPEVEQAIDKRSSMAAIGNLNDYVKLQMAESLGKGDGGGGPGGQVTQFAMGMALANQMFGQAGGILAQATPPAGGPVPPPIPGSAPAPAGGLPELLTPADAGRVLGVSESDVLQALGDGSLKGKKIGTSWRITRSAIEEFLKS
jgi:excisionase family DNA binding protein